MARRRLRNALALVGGLAALTLGAAAPAHADPLGSNDWTCRPSPAHPRPVVLVHGTFANKDVNWAVLSPVLAAHGYCVFALNYGGQPGSPIQGIGPIEDSAAQLSAFVDRVLSATGASQVDIVGHSQGGMLPRYYLRFLGGAAKVHSLVGLAPSNHGTTLDGLATLAAQIPGATDLVGSACPACLEQVRGSAFLTALNAGGDTVPGVTYTVIATRYDEVVTPFTSAFLTGPAVTTIVVQDQCFLDLSEHVAIAADPVAIHDVLNALDPAHATPVGCL